MAKKPPLPLPPPSDAAERLLKLFAGNQRSSGRFDPRTSKMRTEYRPLSIPDMELHLEGKEGVGSVPITDDDRCAWSAVDIDNHEGDEDISIAPIDKYITEHDLPLLACRSKSGGVHVYAFFMEPVLAVQARAVMGKWAAELGYSGSEIFPKQAKLSIDGRGVRQMGNWINLPYMGGAETVRYAVRDGHRLPLEAFVSLAEKLRIPKDGLRKVMGSNHPDAPPCVQKMFASGVAEGHRNEALFNISVYLRKSQPADKYETTANDANAAVFKKPLPKAEAVRTIASAKKEENKYRCQEEPLRTLCERETCMTRKFGVSKAEYEALAQLAQLPIFADLIKFTSDPVRWELTVDGARVMFSTEQLMAWPIIRMAIAEKLLRVVPALKPVEWDRILTELMTKARVMDVPEEASTSGVIRQRLRDYAQKAWVNGKEPTLEDRDGLLRGLPITQRIDDEICVAFRAPDFIAYLKRTKSEELKGVALWAAVRDMVRTTRLRIGVKSDKGYVHVWYLPAREISGAEPMPPEFKSEI